MKKNILNLLIIVSFLVIFSQCNTTKYQYSAYNIVHDKVEETDYYKTLNNYQKDFLILAHIVKDAYPNCREYLSDSIWQISVDAGIRDLESATDTTAILEYQKILALLKNNHTYVVYPFIYNMGEKNFLFAVHYLNGKWIIFNTHKDYPEALIRSQLLAINDIPIDTFYNNIKPYLGEESEENMYHAAYSKNLFGRTVFIKTLGLEYKSNPDSMKLTIKDSSNAERTFMIASKSIKNEIKWNDKGFGIRNTIVKTDSGYIYRIFPEHKLAYLQINQFMDKKAWKHGIKNEVPIVFRPFAFNMLRNAYKGKPSGRLRGVKPGTEDITMFYETFFTKLKESGCENLIIDVRNNTGGNLFYTYQLISFLTDNRDIKTYTRYIKYTDFFRQVGDTKEIEKNYNNLSKTKINYDTLINVSTLEDDYNVFTKIDDPDYEYYVDSKDKKFKGDIYVLTSPNSISAATVFPVLIQDNKLGTIVGRSPANRASKQTSTKKFRLPNTSIVIGLSTVYLVRPDITNTNEILLPDYYVPVELSREDYTFNYVLKLIETKEKKK